MRLIKLIAPATLIAAIALLAPHANAQTMGEYGTATAGIASGGGSMGTSMVNSVSNSGSSDDLGGGSRTWGASSLGASFDERAGAASASTAGGEFRFARRIDGRRIVGRIALAGVVPSFKTARRLNRFSDSSGRFRYPGSIPARRRFRRPIAFRPARARSESPRGWIPTTVHRRGWITVTARTDAVAGSANSAPRRCDAGAPCSRPATRRLSCRPSRTPPHLQAVSPKAACSA